jgi:hypothetical protein
MPGLDEVDVEAQAGVSDTYFNYELDDSIL